MIIKKPQAKKVMHHTWTESGPKTSLSGDVSSDSCMSFILVRFWVLTAVSYGDSVLSDITLCTVIRLVPTFVFNLLSRSSENNHLITLT
jgi:hypothetical protein